MCTPENKCLANNSKYQIYSTCTSDDFLTFKGNLVVCLCHVTLDVSFPKVCEAYGKLFLFKPTLAELKNSLYKSSFFVFQ